ncbi:hypothetical protein PUN28_006079 [Cardiocondyla obscurior]|uniref:Uncharacterized protein n=1 Tax=Cardiocondyla obscurior TaxID=286306 RepID=A0AAW2G9Z5_9HYME
MSNCEKLLDSENVAGYFALAGSSYSGEKTFGRFLDEGRSGTAWLCSGPFPRGILTDGTWRTGRFHPPCLQINQPGRAVKVVRGFTKRGRDLRKSAGMNQQHRRLPPAIINLVGRSGKCRMPLETGLKGKCWQLWLTYNCTSLDTIASVVV